MKNLKKQILSASVAAATLLSLVPASLAAIPSDVQGTRYEEPVQILSALKIMVGDENGEFRLDDTIIRSEVTKMAVHALGLEDAAQSSKGETIFDDVSADHWANGYINLAVSQGIIEGDGDGNFRPNAPITYAEAMTIMVKVTGYGVSAQSQGGYPNGFIKVGTANGLAKNVQGSAREEISRGNVAYLTTNALEVNLMEQNGFGQNASHEITDKTLLSDYLNVTRGSGQVVAIENTSLDGSTKVGNGNIKIGEQIFETAYNMNHLLGYNVNYFLKTEKGSESQIILAMPVKNQNNDLVISADLFSKLTTKNDNTVIEYYENSSSSKTASAQISNDATLIYNGKYESMDTSLLDMTNKSGNVTLLDTDKDGKYDIVFVKNYKNIVVEEITSSNKIVDKYSSETLKLDDDVDFRITRGLDELSLSDLNEYDVLSIAESLDKKLYEIIVTNKNIEGKVTGKDSNSVTIDGNKYKIAANYTDEIAIGTEGIFYLDADGKIAAVDTSSRLSSNYGYLTRAYYVNATDEATFRIFTKEGKEVSFEGRDKIKFNSKSGVKAKEVVSTINGESETTPMQLVTYTVNSDDQLTAINTALDNSATGEVNNEKFTMNYTLTDAKFSKSLSKLGNVRVDENTIVFDITENSDDYAVRSSDVFEDGQKYNAIIYDMSENYTARAIVVTNAQFNASADTDIAIVTDIMDAVNDEDEQTHMLTALSNGKEISLYAEDTDVLLKGESKLEKGDIIQYKTNSDNEIVSIRLLLDISTKDTETTAEPAEKLETVYGKVTKKFSGSINVTVNGGNETNYSIPSEATVYSIDTTKSKNNVNVANATDIQKFDEEENNRVFIKIYDDVVQEIVIIK